MDLADELFVELDMAEVLLAGATSHMQVEACSYPSFLSKMRQTHTHNLQSRYSQDQW